MFFMLDLIVSVSNINIIRQLCLHVFFQLIWNDISCQQNVTKMLTTMFLWEKKTNVYKSHNGLKQWKCDNGNRLVHVLDAGAHIFISSIAHNNIVRTVSERAQIKNSDLNSDHENFKYLTSPTHTQQPHFLYNYRFTGSVNTAIHWWIFWLLFLTGDVESSWRTMCCSVAFHPLRCWWLRGALNPAAAASPPFDSHKISTPLKWLIIPLGAHRRLLLSRRREALSQHLRAAGCEPWFVNWLWIIKPLELMTRQPLWL